MKDWDLCVAFVVLGLGAWVTVNGIYQELPIIAQTAPEGYDIFSYLAIVCAMANFIPFTYLFIRKYKKEEVSPNVTITIDVSNEYRLSNEEMGAVPHISNNYSKTERRVKEKWDDADTYVIIFTLGFVGVLDCIALALFWKSTALVMGKEHSVGLLVGSFVGGCVDCLTSLLFYPFVAQFPAHFTSYLLAGESLTGLLASVLASIQATTNDPSGPLRFSVAVFFLLLAFIMALSAFAFIFLLANRNRPGLFSVDDCGDGKNSDDILDLVQESQISNDSVLPFQREDDETSDKSVEAQNEANVINALHVSGFDKVQEASEHQSLNVRSRHSSGSSSEKRLLNQVTETNSYPKQAIRSVNVTVRDTDLSSSSRTGLGLGESEGLLKDYTSVTISNQHCLYCLLCGYGGWLNKDSGQLFLMQSVISFLENGVLITLLPRALGSYQNSDALISVALKLSAGGATVVALLTQFCHPAPLISKQHLRVNDATYSRSSQPKQTYVLNTKSLLVWILVNFCMIVPSIWILFAARDYTLYGENHSDDNGYFALVIVVLNKWSITFAKTCLFISFHPEKRLKDGTVPYRPVLSEEARGGRGGGGRGIKVGDEGRDCLIGDEEIVITQSKSNTELESNALISASGDHIDNDVLRWGGAGIQVGGLFGALTFFLCTVTYSVL